ncbi:MAG: HIT domain-containing protein [Victivallales bacterium]
MAAGNKRPLWAPWRIEFVTSPKSGRCFLCSKNKRFDGPEEELIIAKGRHVFAILNRFPYNSGHLMIVPYRHVNSLTLLDKKVVYELMDMTLQAQAVMTAAMKPAGFNIGFNIGAAAGAGHEEHVHLHIVPRWVGDTNFMPVLEDTRVVPQALNETAAYLRAEWNRKAGIEDKKKK